MWAVIILGFIAIQGAYGQSLQPSCDQSSCYPATGDLMLGREDRLYASSTCGLTRKERYCIVSHLEDEKKCFFCDSKYPYDSRHNNMSHTVQNIVSQFRGRQKNRWWQAENGLENVYIQLDLEAEFHFTHLILKFKTFRPAAMLVERSFDFGKTWHVYRYFAYDCAKSFPGVKQGPIRDISDVICETRYSDVAPSTGGEIIFRVLPPNIEIENPYAWEVQNLLKMTNLRVNFTKLHTLGDNLLDNRYEIKEKYYYAVYEMVVRGSCSCYGHASRCIPIPGQENNPNMVHGQCECTHNTKGYNCAECDDFYHDLPWKPARGSERNACKRCNCNNHATRCHFDPSVYELTGQVSGGVCDECQHNTMGRHCDECIPHFYHDPNRDITDPHACQPCACDPIGSEHDGECQSHTDPFNDLVAGRCICKRFVTGDRCDMCKAGYWNLLTSNPDGCEACVCHRLGTVGNLGCDKNTGMCTCKRYVAGRTCDTCMPGYWGLSTDEEGCKTCDCDIGGSVDGSCDPSTGQCTCRPHVIGRRCDQPEPGYFAPNLDFYIYEGELARGTGNYREVIRETIAGRPRTWTGVGFMQVSEGDSLEFTVDNLPYSMEYNIVIRYEPQMPERWEDVRLTVVRPGRVDQRGPCANSIPQDDFKATSLPQENGGGSGEDDGDLIFGGDNSEESEVTVSRDEDGNILQEYRLRGALEYSGTLYYVVSPSSCLEKGVSYTIRLDFSRYKSDSSSGSASVLIDSIVLVPVPGTIPRFQQPGGGQALIDDMNRYQCQDQQLPVAYANIADTCRARTFTTTVFMHERALDCDCDPTGSVSAVCNPSGGQCECKPNVIGRRCNQCAPGTYGFGPAGCLACDCGVGARDRFCNEQTGQCLCGPNVYGRKCDECQRGYWGFPSCRPCQCNGRSETCDNRDGRCSDCQGNTGGASCERCANGYYGDPTPGSSIGCRECRCPGGINSDFQHADTCALDIRTNNVICHCRAGYTGPSCNQCGDNYFGNPNAPGGRCQACTCNNNIDPDTPGSCDTRTGECLRCLFHTEGFSCERCKPGYFGDATLQNCQECVCNLLGTDRSSGQCDQRTGQCPCLPSVIGQRCDRCAPNHWKIASGLGCEACSCDPTGSLNTQCNEFDGRCTCRPGRGGRDCSECEDNSWGDPNLQCFPCNCNIDGSETLQCDRRTGQCQCLEGVAGDKCDRCDRGTTGQLPYCVPCGECFDNWDRIIMELKSETDLLVREGGLIKVGGAPGAFDREFSRMESDLEEVRRILSGANVTSTDLDRLRDKLSLIRRNLTDSSTELEGVDGNIQDTATRVEVANNRIDSIKRRVQALKKAAEDLRANATNIRDLDVGGAYNSTRESQRRSQAAQRKVDETSRILTESERTRIQVDQLIADNQDDFERKFRDNENAIREIDGELERLDDKIVDLNEIVCDGRGDPCDDRCGGAGCGHCGGLSCNNGAVTKAEKALDFAKRAENELVTKSEQATELLNEVKDAQRQSDMAKADAQMAYDRALEAKNLSESSRAELQDLMERITDFLGQQGARPAEIRAVAELVLSMSISLTPDQIRDLANQIQETIRGLTDIDAILDATRDDLDRARRLKERADRAKSAADAILSTAERVLAALAEAEQAQNKASEAIGQANQDISDAEGDLDMIETETMAAGLRANSTLLTVRALKNRVDELKRKYVENENNVVQAEREASQAESLAMRAEQDANDLEANYNRATVELDSRYAETQDAKKRADILRDRASTLYQDIYAKMERLRTMEAEFSSNEKHLVDLSDEIKKLNDQMVLYLFDIKEIVRFHRECRN